MEANADPLHPTGAPAPDVPAPPVQGGLQFREPLAAPVYRAVIERDSDGGHYEAQAPTMQEVLDLVWQLQVGPGRIARVAGADLARGEAVYPASAIEKRDARIAELETEAQTLRAVAGTETAERAFAEERWKRARENYRGVLQDLIAAANTLDHCFDCRRRCGEGTHADWCMVQRAGDLLAGKPPS